MDGRENVGAFACRHLRVFAYVGGYAGGEAEYARVPFADVGPTKIPDGLSDEQVLFLSEIFHGRYGRGELRH